MHEVQLFCIVFQGKCPIQRGIAATGNHNTAACKIGFAAHVVLHGPGIFKRFQTFQRWAVGAKGTGTGGNNNGLGFQRGA